MPGPKQPLFIPLGGNLDTGIDDKLLPVGKVPLLHNCYIDRTGEVVKRGGTTALSSGSTPGSSSIEKTWQLAVYKNALISLQLTHSSSPIYLYSAVTGQWSRCADAGTASDAPITSGLKARVAHSLIPVVSEIGFSTLPDATYSSGYYFSCYETSGRRAVLRAIDATTGQVVYSWTASATIGDNPRVIVTNGYLVMIYQDDSAHTLEADVWLISSGFDASVGAPTHYTVATGLTSGSPDHFFDVINAPGVTTACAIAYRTSANTTRRADFTPSTGGVVDVEIKTAAAASINVTQALAWMRDLGVSGKLALITCTAAALQVQWNLTAGTPAATYSLNAAPGTDVRNVAGHTLGSLATGQFNVIYEVYALTDPTDRRVIRFSARDGAGVITDGVWVRSVGLSSTTFLYQGWFWVIANYESPAATQSSFFLLRVPATALSNPQPTSPQGRIALWNRARNIDVNGNTNFNRSNLSSVTAISASQFSAAISTVAGDGNGMGVKVVVLSFDATLGPAREAADGLYVPGSVLAVFPGRSYEEDGFSIFPEPPTGSTAAGGSLTENGSYVYQIVYAFSDENARIHRSVPSTPVTVSLNVTSRLDVDLATQAALPACTAVGAGLGKYLIDTSGLPLVVDGVRVKEGQVVLVKNQAATVDNGVYICTNAGVSPDSWQLTRSPLYDGTTGHVPLAGDVITVRNVSAAENGATNHGKQFALNGAGPFVVDVSALTFTAGTLVQTINLTIPTLRLTNRTVTAEVYRGPPNLTDGTRRLVGTVANNTTVDTVSFADTFSDATVLNGEPIYTDGGVHKNDPAPGLSYLFTFKDRLAGVSMDDPTELWFTDPIVPGIAPNWSEENVVPIADEHGPLYAGAPLDDKVILFKADTIYAFNGDGPDNSGHGSFPAPQIVSVGVGCNNQQGITVSRDGVFFRSTSANVGRKLIDRSLSVVDVGAPVRGNDASTTVAAVTFPSADQVRFFGSGKFSNDIYDIVEKQWSTFGYQDASSNIVHAIAWNGTVAIATDLPSVLVEDQSRSVWTDAGLAYTMAIQSPWVQLAGVRGFQRLSRIQGVGVSVASTPLTVFLFVDYGQVAVSTYRGTPGPAWNWEMVPRVQRGSSFRVGLSETSDTAGHKVSGVTLLIGVKPGVSRQASSTRLVGQ